MVFRTFADDMKKIVLIIIAAVAVLASCNDYETYGDKKEKERNAISKFIADSAFTIISEEQFVKNGNKTDLSRREFVKLDKSGVYMQIVREGCGDMIKDGESLTIDCRFTEFDILNDTSTIYNTTVAYASMPDRMAVTRTSGTYTASFISGLMTNIYSTSVPAGWLVPFSYIKVGRPQSMTEECAKVRLIVPHTQGHAYASSNVCPYFYTITFQREL
jgi:hypothetical protein